MTATDVLVDRARRLRRTPELVVAALIALCAAAATFWIATDVFAYHSSNHDEAVYLSQAALLLDGQLQYFAGDLTDAVHPWFYVEDGGRLYPKYTPVPAAMFAVSMALFGEPRVTLALVAGANAALAYALGATAFDRRVGVVAAALLAAAPMALVTGSTFLPYAPTTTWNLLFAVCYLNGVRSGGRRWAAAAGLATGIAFFARPYTAVLFAAPFILHALWQIAGGVRERLSLSELRERGAGAVAALRPLPDPVARNALTAAGGLAFVGVTLTYNATLTGDPLVFPYQEFAPQDGPGFGRRRILGHSIVYTPELALEANLRVLRQLVTRWFTGGLVGTACALAGLALAARRVLGDDGRLARLLPDVDATAAALLAGLFVTVPVGNVPFWGNFNVLGSLTDPTDGFVSAFGPFYHYDLLAPLAVFAAAGLIAGWRALSIGLRRRAGPDVARVALALVLLVALPVGAVGNAGLVDRPLEEHAATGDNYEQVYEPIEETEFDDAVVFLPTPYGEWSNHPFQYLRNEPGLDGPVVYALDRDPGEDFAVLDAYPDRTYYRYSYRGEWTPGGDDGVVPKLERLDVREARTFDGETTVGVPPGVESARVELETGYGAPEYTIREPNESVTVEWTLDRNAARLVGPDGNSSSVRIDAADELELAVTMVATDGSTLTYRQAVDVRVTGDGVQVVWPPERRVCTLVLRCGSEGTYLPDHPDEHVGGVDFETTIAAANASGSA